MTDTHWWDTHDNVVTLCYWMAEHLYTADDVAAAVEKPWKYTDEWLQASDEIRP